MNDATVGMENLPNVFIDRIDLYPMKQPGTGLVFRYRVEVKLCMYDYSPRRSWYGREDLSSLDIKVVFRGGAAAIALNDGGDTLFDYSPAAPAVIVINQSSFSIEDELDGYTKFSTTVEISLPTQDSLNVYAACFIAGLDFGNDLFNKFYGPMAAEKIFAGGIISEESGYFYYPETNEEYGGPVHQHPNSGYMEGSEHSTEPHAKLRYVSEENYKIRFPIEIDAGFIITTDMLNSQSEEAGVRLASGTTGVVAGTIEANVTSQTMMEDELIENAAPTDFSEDIALALTQRPQAQNLLASVNFEIRDAIRRGIY
jgi:hypothetical protein